MSGAGGYERRASLLHIPLAFTLFVYVNRGPGPVLDILVAETHDSEMLGLMGFSEILYSSPFVSSDSLATATP